MWLWRGVFLTAAVWTGLGAIPALVDPVTAFGQFYGIVPNSKMVIELFQGAWGQSLLFAAGYAIAAVSPVRHAAIVLLGGTGKAVYAVRLLAMVVDGEGGALAVVAIAGDLVFAVLFALFLCAPGVLRSMVLPCAPRVAAHDNAST